jgi:hypothetical protein
VVTEQLPVVVASVVLVYFGSALAEAIDKIVTARPATKSDAVFIAVSSQSRDGGCHPDVCTVAYIQRVELQIRPLKASFSTDSRKGGIFDAPENTDR